MNIKYKTYSPINEENLSRAFNDLNKGEHEYIDCKHLEVEDKILLIYREKDRTIPPPEDSQHFSHQPSMQNYPENPNKEGIVEIIKQYWFIAAPVAVGIIWYFFIRKP